MDRLIELLNDKSAPALVVFLTLTALVIRVLVLIYWVDVPGDGPTKAMYAYNWHKSPYIVTQGVWLPGFLYLTGLFSFIVPNPLISIRILNLILGTLTIPMFYLLVRKVFGNLPALFAAGVLSLLPLHVGLSASSMTDVSFLLEIIAGIFFIIKATEMTSKRKAYLAMALFCLCLAEMTRYEAWVFVPFFPAYLYWKTRRLRYAILVTFVLSLFPISWMAGNYIHNGDFLLGFTAAKVDAWGSEVGLFEALKIMGKMTVQQLEWTLVLFAFWGMMLFSLQGLQKKLRSEQVLYLVMTCFFWILMFHFAKTRGISFQERYLLFGLVNILAFAAVPLFKYFEGDKKLLLGAIAFILFSFILPKLVVYYPVKDVTRKKPIEIREIAFWLKESPYRHSSILMTRMRERSTFLPLYFPEVGDHFPNLGANGRSHLIYAKRLRMADSKLKRFLSEQRPALLITADEDYEVQQRIEAIYGSRIVLGNPIHTQDDIKVYEIRSIMRDNNKQTQM